MISIVDNGLHIEDGVLRYAWFRLDTPHGERWRAVTFRELASVPYDVAKETDTLGRQWAALRGIYNADVDYVYTALGIFHPEHVGIVQLYGAAGEGQNRETAAVMALKGWLEVRGEAEGAGAPAHLAAHLCQEFGGRGSGAGAGGYAAGTQQFEYDAGVCDAR